MVGLKFFKPKVSLNKPMAAREGTSGGLGLLVRPEKMALLGSSGGCLDSSRKAASGSGYTLTQGTKKRIRKPLPVSWSSDPMHAKSTLEGMRGELGLIANLLVGEGLQADFGDNGVRARGGGGWSARQCRPRLR